MKSAIERSKGITDPAAVLRELATFTDSLVPHIADDTTTEAWKELQLAHIMTEVGALRIYLHRQAKERLAATLAAR